MSTHLQKLQSYRAKLIRAGALQKVQAVTHCIKIVKEAAAKELPIYSPEIYEKPIFRGEKW